MIAEGIIVLTILIAIAFLALIILIVNKEDNE